MSKILGRNVAIAGREFVLVCGSFGTNGTGAPLTPLNGAELFSLTRTGVGTFLLVFKETYEALLCKWVDLSSPTVAAVAAQLGAFTQGTPATGARSQIVLSTLAAAATPTDIAANADSRVSYGFVFRKTSVV